MPRKSKFFRVATEGATTDGRKIERKWLQQAAKNFDPLTYGARVFMEHIRGINPAWGFSCLGDVLALETREVDGKLALFAQIDPTDELVTLTDARQKIYSSIEIAENFANTGEAYLVGLGVTDSPASLGTEILAFASQNPAVSPFT
ncbi:MAG: GPO family capsid scaffolding protein, partial [Lysobacter sp.]